MILWIKYNCLGMMNRTVTKSAVMMLSLGFLIGILTFIAVKRISFVTSGKVNEDWPDTKLFGSHNSSEPYHKGEDVWAQKIAEQVRVLCWVLTTPATHKRAQHVKVTWGSRCNILLFISSENDTSLPTVKLSARDGYDYLWGQTKGALTYIYNHHLQDADWFFKADDDTYTVVENLRYMLLGFNASDSLNFGLRFKAHMTNGFMSGGPGYVLSREALKRFVEKALPDEDKCRQDDYGAEDMELARCVQSVGVNSVDTRDSYGRGRFFDSMPESYILSEHNPLGISCCSDMAVTFHKVSPIQMHILEYLIYHLRPYGIS